MNRTCKLETSVSRWLIAILGALFLICACAQAAELAPPQKAIVVKLAAGLDAGAATRSFAAHGTTDIAGLDAILNGWAFKKVQPVFCRDGRTPRDPVLFNRLGLNRYLVLGWESGAAPRTPEVLDQILGQLRQAPAIEEAERNAGGKGDMTPDDPDFPDQWHHFAINSTSAWDYVTGAPDVLIAVIDSGISPDNDDFDYSLIDHYWDYVEGDADPQDECGHGTHVAGIIAAQANNANKIAGLAWNCRILNCRVLDEYNNGLYSDWAAAIEDAADAGADILNLSLGGSSSSSILSNACYYAYGLNCILAVAMGNDDSGVAQYPAAYACVFTVGATSEDDARVTGGSWGSNYGPNIDVVAPGEDILSTYQDSTLVASGTSMATPMVSALAALLVQTWPGIPNEFVQLWIGATADDEVGDPAEDTPGYDVYMGNGLINYGQAVSLAYAASTCTLAFATAESPTPIALLKPYYWLRDAKLRATPAGRKLIADYYASTAGIAPVVRKDAKLMFRLLSCVEQYSALIDRLKAAPSSTVVLPRPLWEESCAVAAQLLPKLDPATRDRIRPWIDRGRTNPTGLFRDLQINAVVE